jgi:hypothetical protein
MRRETDAAPELFHRADRSIVQVPMVYRRDGGLIWYDGKIENVSTSGLLFHGEKPLSPGEVLQISYRLPAVGPAVEPTEVFCWAKVVRIRLANGPGADHTNAVKILRYRTQPRAPADIRNIIGDGRGEEKRAA